MQLGCQTYTWEMLGPAFTGDAGDLVNAIADAGYAGIEITNMLIGAYAEDALAFKALLDRRGLAFVAYALSAAGGYTDPAFEAENLRAIDRAMDFLAPFPGTVLSLGCPTDFRGAPEAEGMEQAGRIFNEAGRRGRERSIPVAVHPSSHHGSLVVTRTQYQRLMEVTDPALVKWVPDTGHIIRGAQDVRETLSLYRDRILYVHLKDADRAGRWQMLGEGVCAVQDVLAHLGSLGFDGWIVAEEESERAGQDPAAAVAANRRYLQALMST